MSDKRMSADYQRNVSDFVRNNVVCCVSSLVSDVAKLVSNADSRALRETSFDEDDLQALMSCEDWETPGREKIGEMDRDELLEALDWDSEDANNYLDDELRSELAKSIESDPNFDDWETFGRHHDLDPEYGDVYEHWNVDPWFGARLKEHGEVVGDFGNLTVWGRCTTGQSISLDFVVCQIYDELHAS